MSIRAAVIGLGMGKNHAKSYHELPDAELAAICDVDSARLQEYAALYPEAAVYSSYEDMLAQENLDAVSIALPNFLHDKVTIAALEAGVNVLCEKPMALNAQRAQAMTDAAEQTGKKLMIHFNWRYTPQAQWLKHYVDEGHLGDIYYVKTRWLRARGIPKPGGWFGIKEFSGGGPLIDLGVHRLDLAMWAMGYPQALTVSASTFGGLGQRLASERGVKYDVEDLATALIRLDNGVTLSLEASWAGGTDQREDMLTALYGTKGAAIQRNTGEGYEFEAFGLQDLGGTLTRVEPRLYPEKCPTAVGDFVRCLIDDTEPPASAQHGLTMMKLIDALYLSARENREVVLDE